LKAVSSNGQLMYSNIIALKSNLTVDAPFIVSTFNNGQLTVTAFENYQFKLSDLNGRVVAIGSGNKGMNKIDISNQSNGMYIIQLFGTTKKQVERVVKQ
jgi:hypothetical protein